MPEQLRELAERWFEEVWNKGREEAIDELAAPDAESYGFPQPESTLNPHEFKEYVREFRRTFSEVHVSIDETVSEEDRIAIRWTGTMRHTGSGLGFAPTGRTAKVSGMTLLHIREGRIYRGWNALDLGNVIARLSAISAQM